MNESDFQNYIQPHDIVKRLLCRHPVWYHGEPKVVLTGDVGSFGKLSFDFGDDVVEYNIYIKNRDQILDAAHLAIKNYPAYAEPIIRLMY